MTAVTLRCKPGDLAIVVRGFFCNTYAGRIVEVLNECWMDGANEMPEAGPAWSVRFREPILRLDGSVHDVAICPDAWLRPITPPHLTENCTRTTSPETVA